MNDSVDRMLGERGRRALAWLVVIGAGLAGVTLGRVTQVDAPLLSNQEGAVETGLWLTLTAALVISVMLIRRIRRAAPCDGVIHDPDTGLYRREYVDEAVRGLMARDDRAENSQMALVLVSADYADETAARYGAEGTAVVERFLGSQLSGQVRGGDLPVQHDEGMLAVYLQCAELEQALAFGRRINMLLSRQQLDIDGDVVKVSACMGVALRAQGEDIEPLIERAREKLAEARRSGASAIVG